MPVSQQLLKSANNAALSAMLNQWEQSGGSQSAAPMSANSKVAPRALSPELAAALAAHLKLPKGMAPDELDAAETRLSLEGGDFGAAKKQAKVYDCSEPVEGMKPKMQYEEHKDISPDEFSRESSKSAAIVPPASLAHIQKMLSGGKQTMSDQFNGFMNKLVNTPAGNEIYFNRLGLGGAIAGGVGGALSAPKGKMLKRTLLGAGVGGLTGLGAGAGASLGLHTIPTEPFKSFNPTGYDKLHNGRGAILGLLGGGALTNVLANKAVKETGLDDSDEDKQEAKDLAEMRQGLAKISSAAALKFGAKVARVLSR